MTTLNSDRPIPVKTILFLENHSIGRESVPQFRHKRIAWIDLSVRLIGRVQGPEVFVVWKIFIVVFMMTDHVFDGRIFGCEEFYQLRVTLYLPVGQAG